MRTTFIQELILQARLHPEIFLMVGDLGYSVVEPFAREFPDRYLNAGVAEQNMTGMAAGLASEGFHVFTYSIANFPTLRCFEQIRNDVGYHRVPVTVVSVGAGMSYGSLGYSHHAVQDIGVMRTLPEMTIFSPADPGETRQCVQWLAQNPCPSYLRLGKAGEPELHCIQGLDTILEVRPGGQDCAIVCTGSILKVALDAAQELETEGIQAGVFSCPVIQPMSMKYLQPLSRCSKLVVLEEHVAAGGFASLLREHLPDTVKIAPFALSASTIGDVGSQDCLRMMAGLSSTSVARAFHEWLG